MTWLGKFRLESVLVRNDPGIIGKHCIWSLVQISLMEGCSDCGSRGATLQKYG